MNDIALNDTCSSLWTGTTSVTDLSERLVSGSTIDNAHYRITSTPPYITHLPSHVLMHAVSATVTVVAPGYGKSMGTATEGSTSQWKLSTRLVLN
ncbi:hypothetical protein J6590_001567 [Homalodisca vitripennis]|nr:hypothetical protein J6590_001567 [Homalodisca vitripennis]